MYAVFCQELAEKLVTAMAVTIDDPRDVLGIMADPTHMLVFLQRWAQSSACENAIDAITVAIRSVLIASVENLSKLELLHFVSFRHQYLELYLSLSFARSKFRIDVRRCSNRCKEGSAEGTTAD